LKQKIKQRTNEKKNFFSFLFVSLSRKDTFEHFDQLQTLNTKLDTNDMHLFKTRTKKFCMFFALTRSFRNALNEMPHCNKRLESSNSAAKITPT